ncbi:hypothetical protein EDB83DRAFT_173211 [Lactarius deliciosus]|nr:hypothetical protein EDB83DRAFT_173211 [Lactarius deliciosus]
MPKRIPTPPPPEDEPRYLTVLHPYPLHANLDLPADRITLALWLACCTGKDVLLAMFHKPASPGMVVIEVDREFDRFDELLGLHAWSGFLLKPSEEQMDKSSKVFYCTYNTGRLVEKNGWKRVSIEERWFQGWFANNSVIRFPYPKTSYCDVPSEAKTGAPMCRPLPQRSFPVPPPTPAPPVGSAEWLASRNANVSVSPAPSSTKKGKRSMASDTASVTSASSRRTGSFSPPPSQSPTPSVMANYRAKNGPAWKRGPPSISAVASAVTSRAPSTIGSSSARSSTGPARPRTYDPDGPIEPARAYDYTEEDQPRPLTVAAMSDIIEDELASIATSVGSGSGGTRPLGLDDPECVPCNPPAEAAVPVSDQSKAGNAATMWGDYAKPQERELTGEWYCSQHGPLCKPGICKERARVEREKRQSDGRKKREEEKKTRDARREKAQKKRGKKAKSMCEGESGRELPPHLFGNALGGGGSNNNNGSDNDSSHGRDSSTTPPPDQEDGSIPLNTGGTDMPVSSSRRACGSVDGSGEEEEDNDDDGASVARSNTSSTASRGSRATPPASVSPIGRANTPQSNGPKQVSLTSPRPATQQSASDTRSAASQSSSMGDRSGGPSVSSNSRASAVSGASATGSDTYQRSGMGPATQQSSRSSATSSVRSGASPPTPSMPSVANGFPTFADTEWGDPIATALAKEGGKKSKNGRRREDRARSARAVALAQAQATQANVLESALDVQPGGPGSSWGDPNEAW